MFCFDVVSLLIRSKIAFKCRFLSVIRVLMHDPCHTIANPRYSVGIVYLWAMPGSSFFNAALSSREDFTRLYVILYSPAVISSQFPICAFEFVCVHGDVLLFLIW